MKVTDKRMFTAEGELREEFRALSNPQPTEAPPQETPQAQAPIAQAAPSAPPLRDARDARDAHDGRDDAAYLELPGTPPGLGRPSFFDLVSLLAEPIALYLGDLTLPDGSSAENLEMARLHIDLLDVLREKTVGNVTAQESAVLEDLLYRSRVRYVQLRG